MTKEELYKIIDQKSSCASYYKGLLDQFFSQNVVIPKGEKRHPYADVLHDWVEGSEIYGRRGQTWGSRNLCIHAFRDDEYRIKLEPVYEWQWYKIVDGVVQVKNELGKDGRDQFFTEEETSGFGWIRFEETKRERK